MDERLGHVIRNQTEEIWILLRGVGGNQEVELRVHEHPSRAKAELVPGTERIAIPLDLLPVLVKALAAAQNALVTRGLICAPPSAKITHMEQGDAGALRTEDLPKARSARQDPRVTLNVRGECRLLDKKDFWPGKPLVGEVVDLSAGGAGIRLPQRFPRFSQVELFMVVDGMVFRGRAEVAGADAEIQTGRTSGQFRHSLRWVSLEDPAKEVLTKLVASRAQKRTDPAG